MIQGACHCGEVTWRFDRVPEDATACNCTVCRRYGVLWAYDYEGEAVHVAGPTTAYVRHDKPADGHIGFHFCPACGCLAYWRAVAAGPDGRRRLAVNLRLALDPAEVAAVPIDHFDGLASFKDLPRDGRTIGDYWF